MSAPGENVAGRIVSLALDEANKDRTALREGDRCLSFSELADQVRRTAQVLVDEGMEAGDRVAVYLPDCLESAVSILGAIYAGGVAMPVSELVSSADLRNRLRTGGAAYCIVDASLRENVDDIRDDLAALREVISVGDGEASAGDMDLSLLVSSAEPMEEPAEVAPTDPALLLFSAAAADKPHEDGLRGVMHDHATPFRAFESYAVGFLGMNDGDKVFSSVRMATAYGLGIGLLFPMLAAAESLLMPEQIHSERVFNAVESFEPTIFAATPSVFGQLARDAQSTRKGKVLAGARWCVAGAEDMPPKVIAMTRALLGSNVAVGYGLTEAFQFVMTGLASGRRPGGCGEALDGFELRIVDDDGNEVGVDEIGTLQIRGDNVIDSYWKHEDSALEDGWFTTRDRFMVDSEGKYYHCGRVDHLFKVGGKWVAPAEVEHALLANEAVWECAVIGADDEDGLIKPFAFVVPNLGQAPGPELEAELRSYVKAELAPYKYPRWIEFVDELPKGPTGVILRYKLRERLLQSTTPRPAETRSEDD